MGHYVLRRLIGALAVIVGLICFTFLATRLIGDPVSLMVDRENATEQDIAAIQDAMGLNDPVAMQFANYVGNVVQGDFGDSMWQRRPATDIVLERIPSTLQLAGLTVLFSLVISVVLAIVAAMNRGKPIERVIVVGSTALACIPSFWLALTLILILAVRVTMFPTSGYGEPRHFILPILALSAQPIGYFTQVLHTGLVQELNEHYVRTARAKGLRSGSVMTGHVFRNVSILTVTMLGAMLASLVNGTVLAESVFAWPGVGQLGLEAVHQRDLPVLTAVIFYAGVTVTLINLLVDVLYVRLDPRIRLQ